MTKYLVYFDSPTRKTILIHETYFLLCGDTIKCLGPEAVSGLVEADTNSCVCLAVNHVH